MNEGGGNARSKTVHVEVTRRWGVLERCLAGERNQSSGTKPHALSVKKSFAKRFHKTICACNLQKVKVPLSRVLALCPLVRINNNQEGFANDGDLLLESCTVFPCILLCKVDSHC